MVEGWRRESVGSLFDVQLGKMLNKTAKEKTPQYPYLTNINVRWGAFDVSQLNTMFFSDVEKRKFKLRRGDILVCEGGEIGRCAVWDGLLTPCYYQKALHRLRPKGPILPRYFQVYMEHISGTKILTDFSSRTSIAHLTREKLIELPVLLPPLSEQRKIAEILRTWDEAIEAATKLVTALNARREALRTKLVTEADRGGRLTFFGEFLEESRILGSDGASARKITVKLYGKGAVPKSDKRDGSTKTRYYLRSPGQLIYSKLDFLNGAFALIPESLQGYESSLDLPAFDIGEQVNPQWLIEYLTRPAYYTAQLHLARGQRKARRIAPADFLASPVKLPPRARQDEIAAVLAVADCELALRETELDTLTRQKRGLMQKLLIGEWRVNTIDSCHAEPRGRK